ncbi:UNVERIFIED_CONTAM: hypothetical protein Scaly_2024300 [Sesamum calycinum]|uniref:Uncharacterized protein n=1 Tax=Sesamum calycinum TaxID=2727403 RepID=A0AAW2N1S1_9LAMI
MCAYVDVYETTTYEEAITSPNANEWTTTMELEMSSMVKNNVWDLVGFPARCKITRNKWVLKVKRKADGSIDKLKARSTAAELRWRQRVDGGRDEEERRNKKPKEKIKRKQKIYHKQQQCGGGLGGSCGGGCGREEGEREMEEGEM